MDEITPTGTLAALLARFGDVGGVVEHVLISVEDVERATEAVHRAAALFTLDVVARGINTHFERVLQMPEYRGRSRDEFFAVAVDPERLVGRPISVGDFLGSWWDRARRSLVRANDMNGYAFAFFDPPYKLYDRHARAGLSDVAAAELFGSLTDLLFDGFSRVLVVYEWSTDCSNYFDAGREWWGSFFWTAEAPGSGQIVGVAASSTD